MDGSTGKCDKRLMICAVFFVLWIGNLVLDGMNLVLFYPVPHFGFLMLLAALICMIAFLFRSGHHTSGALTLAGTFLLLLLFMSLTAVGSSRTGGEVTCTLPGSGNNCVIRRENAEIGPGADTLIADEILIPYVLVRRSTARIAATGKPVTEAVTLETDEAGNLLVFCEGKCVLQYSAETRRWKSQE